MARMLQALKNLEARSAKTAGEGWLAHLAEKPPQREIQPHGATLMMPAVVMPAVMPVVKEPEALVNEPPVKESPPAVARPSRRADAPPREPPTSHTEVNREDVAPAERLAVLPLEPSPAPRERSAPVSSRKPSSLERQIRRTLSDLVRSQPLVQLADRLRRDAEQTASKTLLFVGVGEASATHETLLYTATLLAEKHGERVLVIDADMARRSVTAGLDQGQSPGLAEVLRSSEPLSDRCQLTALPGVSLVPAGLLREVDLPATGTRLEEMLRQAAHDYSLVLIDGGRSGDLAASTLARLADATYFVVQLGTIEASEAQAALRDFRAASARILGCIAT
jgi:Mrp family chromosome partitioning ATPase